MLPFQRADITKCLAYTLFFFLTLFGYNRVFSPVYETTYNSALLSVPEKIVAKSHTHLAPIPLSPKPKKKALLSLSFRPEYISLQDNTIEILKKNVYSRHFQDKVAPLSLIIDTVRSEPRGQVSGNTLILSSRISDDSELLKVFVHELAHIIDIYYLKKGAFADPSDRFYGISWERHDRKNRSAKTEDFVSGYALSNQYEDFAESLSFYVFHNEAFKRRAKDNPVLAKKYDFFRDVIFTERTFIDTSFEYETVNNYNWDTTKIPVNVKKYLYYIE